MYVTHLKASALGYTVEEILNLFFDKVTFEIAGNKLLMTLVPERLRGETATFDIEANGKVYVERGRRITARHIKALEKDNVTQVEVPTEYIAGKVAAKDYVDLESGEIICPANGEISLEVLANIYLQLMKQTTSLLRRTQTLMRITALQMHSLLRVVNVVNLVFINQKKFIIWTFQPNKWYLWLQR
jgi:hypothetical protein